MALDLGCGVFWISLTSVVSFLATRRLLQQATGTQRATVAAIVVALGAIYFFCGWDQIWLSRLLPNSALIVLGNWFPILASALAGIVSCVPELPMWRRLLAMSGMLITACYALAFPLLGSTPTCASVWRDNICLQSTSYTCSAASAATLLNHYGIDATEAEMAELCLTNSLRNGTSWQGLYRGLVLKTAGTAWRVEVFRTEIANSHALHGAPSILVACLPHEGQHINPIYREACGWVPGQAHAVVYMGAFDSKTSIIGDPQFGRELWTEADLNALWTGLAFRLVAREGDGVCVE